VGLGSMELGLWRIERWEQIHVIEGQYIRSNCHYELSWTHLYVKFPSSRRSPQFKASTVPHWCLPSRGGARRVSSGSRGWLRWRSDSSN
jgi:hypothetical protein